MCSSFSTTEISIRNPRTKMQIPWVTVLNRNTFYFCLATLMSIYHPQVADTLPLHPIHWIISLKYILYRSFHSVELRLVPTSQLDTVFCTWFGSRNVFFYLRSNLQTTGQRSVKKNIKRYLFARLQPSRS